LDIYTILARRRGFLAREKKGAQNGVVVKMVAVKIKVFFREEGGRNSKKIESR